MVALRLVHLIEKHAETIAVDLVTKIQTSQRTSDMRDVPRLELLTSMRELLQHLGDWLLTKAEIDIECRYRAMGARWADQGIALAHACQTVIMTKEGLWDFLQKQALLRSPVELYGEMELLWLLDRFFDRALCSVVEGYAQSEWTTARAEGNQQLSCAEVNLTDLVP